MSSSKQIEEFAIFRSDSFEKTPIGHRAFYAELTKSPTVGILSATHI
jgi:hypothetical protein